MALVEQLAFSLWEEGRGVHALLWDDMGDLVRVLLVTHAALGDIPIEPRFASGGTKQLEEIRELIQARVAEQILHEMPGNGAGDPNSPPHPLWILFLQQAASEQ